MIASPNDLIYFLELSNTLNFSRASERIGISQPSLSVAMKRLEQSIGTSLFIRGKNGVFMTQAGKRLQSHAKQLLQSWDSVKSECLASKDEIQGSFVFGAHPSVSLYSLPHFLPDLLTTWSNLEIKLKHDLSRKILEEIVNMSVDIGIVVNPLRHPDLIVQKLYDDQVTFWRSANVKSTKMNIETGNTVIMGDPDLAQTQWLLKKLHRNGTQYKRFVASNNMELVAQLTAKGAGIGILPASVAHTNCPKQIMPIPGMPVYHDEICLVYRNENRDIKAMKAIIASIKSHFKKPILGSSPS